MVWDTIRAHKRHSTAVLITHSMAEADLLCDRVGMVDHGRMRCVGAPNELKARFGVGHTLSVLFSAHGAAQAVIAYVAARFFSFCFSSFVLFRFDWLRFGRFISFHLVQLLFLSHCLIIHTGL